MASTRDELNRADANRLAAIFNKLELGDIVNRLLSAGGTDVPAATVGADIAAFTNPPTAPEMALLRTFVNALKADLAAVRTALIAAGGATEQGVTVTSNVATLAARPSTLITINATAGTTTGVKQLLVGPITGQNAIAPLPGQAVWDGNVKVLFSTADAVTTADFLYTKTSDTTVSVLQAPVESI